MKGIIIVDKPREFTSFDVVAVMRGLLRTKKVGHGGTLDPMATGVLPVFVGGATKAVDILPDSDKGYRAGFELGYTSDTLDIWGELAGSGTAEVSREALERALEKFRGDIMQVPPMYSALKVNGQKLCDLARKGISVERKPRPVRISRLDCTEFDGRKGVIEVDCSSGTYIRSLIDDIGAELGTGAVMTSLVRTRACGFDLSRSTPLEAFKSMGYEELCGKILPVESVFSALSRVELDEVQKRLYLNGVRLDADRLLSRPPADEPCAVYGGEFLGVAMVTGGELVSVKRFS
ncbi:MAG: tRNA pseudouridine(55) synthase TruB [Oscillospiraceae bacterium]|nr:tRNA pseudouridine(55) synthase TruB [Oscillospiraceae bacterium]